MGELIISADRDDSAANTANTYGRETAPASKRRDTELWHIPKESAQHRTLCGANLAGKFKRTKGHANCRYCQSLASLRSFNYERYAPILRALYLGLEVPPYKDKWASHEGMLDADLVTETGGKLALTRRGKIVARDIVNPAGWLDTKTRLFHKRRPMAIETICGITCGNWTAIVQCLDELHVLTKKNGRRVFTCVRCAIHVEPRADVG